jgi:DNA-binding MarR family transcriptional regulator
MSAGNVLPLRELKLACQTPIIEVLNHITKASRILLGISLAELGLVRGQDEMLMALQIGSPIAVSSLAVLIGVRPSTVSKMADRLIESGVVRRSADPLDSRKTLIVLTPAGLAVRSKILAIYGQLEADFREAYGAAGAKQIAASLSMIDAVLTSRLARLR